MRSRLRGGSTPMGQYDHIDPRTGLPYAPPPQETQRWCMMGGGRVAETAARNGHCGIRFRREAVCFKTRT